MNFLAHIYLSGENDETKVGNFIGDWVKGKNYENYPEKIKNGILLHRAIDSFTDSNLIYRHSRKITAAIYGKYAGIVTDIFYDHFLASQWNRFSNIPLNIFSRMFYKNLVFHYNYLPTEVRRFLPFMMASDRLFSYQSTEGIRKAVQIMSERTTLPDFTNKAMILLNEKYSDFLADFNLFFPELQTFGSEHLKKISENKNPEK
jgi:acyl carrier protein phosphodiesterase